MCYPQEPKWIVDIDRAATITYKVNHKDTIVSVLCLRLLINPKYPLLRVLLVI